MHSCFFFPFKHGKGILVIIFVKIFKGNFCRGFVLVIEEAPGDEHRRRKGERISGMAWIPRRGKRGGPGSGFFCPHDCNLFSPLLPTTLPLLMMRTVNFQFSPSHSFSLSSVTDKKDFFPFSLPNRKNSGDGKLKGGWERRRREIPANEADANENKHRESAKKK